MKTPEWFTNAEWEALYDKRPAYVYYDPVNDSIAIYYNIRKKAYFDEFDWTTYYYIGKL